MSKKTKERAHCIFCEKSGVTKQHIWPDWMKSVVSRQDDEHTQFIMRMDEPTPGLVVLRPEVQVKRGPFGARKIRNVCGACNSGWMSRLETAAKQCLTDLILGKSASIDPAMQLTLAAWSAMISIMAEYTDKPTQSIPPEHRHHLMVHGTPPGGWFIWIAAYEGENWKQRYRHQGMIAVEKTDLHLPRPPHNTQFSTFVVGSFFLHTASTTASISPSFFSSLDRVLLKIWPPNTTSTYFPGKTCLLDDDADRIADFFFNALNYPPAVAS